MRTFTRLIGEVEETILGSLQGTVKVLQFYFSLI